jgi:NADH-quinone oxidoreductase subunit C
MNDSVPSTPSIFPEARLDALAEALQQRFGGTGAEIKVAFGEVTLVVPVGNLLETAVALRDEPVFRFEEMIDACGVDYAAYGQVEWATESASAEGFGRGQQRDLAVDAGEAGRFAAVYHLLSLSRNVRLRLKAFLSGDPPLSPSLVGVWSAADWFEREAFDLYGILFDGHPDLRRILTDYGFIGHPFRKDFPLVGQVEMRYDPEQRRVVYQPVSIEQRPHVPRVIRDDNRYLGEHP